VLWANVTGTFLRRVFAGEVPSPNETPLNSAPNLPINVGGVPDDSPTIGPMQANSASVRAENGPAPPSPP